MVPEPVEPRTWVLTASDEAVVLAQWLEIELALGAHAVELRGALSAETALELVAARPPRADDADAHGLASGA